MASVGGVLGTIDRQGSLLGVDSLLSTLFEGDDSSFYARMASHCDEIISDEDFAGCYSSGWGRPSIPPSLLMRTPLRGFVKARSSGSLPCSSSGPM